MLVASMAMGNSSTATVTVKPKAVKSRWASGFALEGTDQIVGIAGCGHQPINVYQGVAEKRRWAEREQFKLLINKRRGFWVQSRY
jgi:hypothetical protein